MNIGVIGIGVVGSALVNAIRAAGETAVTYDKFKESDGMKRVVECPVIFVCVPTPSNDGVIDLSAVFETFTILGERSYSGTVVLKSTVLPGTSRKLASAFKSLNVVHNPEFLTERNAAQDFLEQKAIILSGPDPLLAANVYHQILPKTSLLLYSDWEVTEAAKYMHNCFLATKVAWFNQFYNYVEKDLNIDYQEVLGAALSQGMIGENHTKVPGPDGKFGFGGLCFPKDTDALLNSGPNVFAKLSILNEAVRFNKTIRAGAYDGSEKRDVSL